MPKLSALARQVDAPGQDVADTFYDYGTSPSYEPPAGEYDTVVALAGRLGSSGITVAAAALRDLTDAGRAGAPMVDVDALLALLAAKKRGPVLRSGEEVLIAATAGLMRARLEEYPFRHSVQDLVESLSPR